MTLVQVPAQATPIVTGSSTLSSYIGQDASSALSRVTSYLSTVSAYVAGAAGVAGTIVGQLTPVASLIGAGGLLARGRRSAHSGISPVLGRDQLGGGTSDGRFARLRTE